MGFRINTETYADGALFNVHDGNFVLPGSGASFISGPNAARARFYLQTQPIQRFMPVRIDLAQVLNLYSHRNATL